MSANAWRARKLGQWSDEAKAERQEKKTRRLVARQQPPHLDRRTKRNRTRSEQNRRAIEEN